MNQYLVVKQDDDGNYEVVVYEKDLVMHLKGVLENTNHKLIAVILRPKRKE